LKLIFNYFLRIAHSARVSLVEA